MKSYHPSIVFTLTVLCIFALPQIGIDLYLPALPSITTSLQSSIASGQASMSIYIFSMGVTQLFYGPWSDIHGRKPVILSGIVIFFCGSLIASMAPSMAVFLLGRAIQGVGMGSGFTVASAILADEFKGAELARMSSYSSMVFSSSPLLAPVLGGYIAHYFYWQVNFYVMAVLSLLLFLAFMALLNLLINHPLRFLCQ